jgi:hypothetical protein
MDFFGTKTHGEKEDEEAERLVRPLPKKKPPRRDRRRDDMQADRDPDTDADKDLKGDPDLSLNYKNVGGSIGLIARVVARFSEPSLEERVARRYLEAKLSPKVLQKKKEKKQQKRQQTLQKRKPAQTGPAKYVSVSDAEQGGKTVSVTEQAAKNNPSRYKPVKDEEKKADPGAGGKPQAKPDEDRFGKPIPEKKPEEVKAPAPVEKPEAKPEESKPEPKEEPAPPLSPEQRKDLDFVQGVIDKAKKDPEFKEAIQKAFSSVDELPETTPLSEVKGLERHPEIAQKFKTVGELRKWEKSTPDWIADHIEAVEQAEKEGKPAPAPKPPAEAPKPEPKPAENPEGQAPKPLRSPEEGLPSPLKGRKRSREGPLRRHKTSRPKQNLRPERRSSRRRTPFLISKLPPDVRAEMLTLHPEDVKAAISNYSKFQASSGKPKSAKDEIAVAAGYASNPMKVTTLPKKGVVKVKTDTGEEKEEEKPFAELPEEQQVEMAHAHRMAVYGASLATRSRVANAMKNEGVPEHLASDLAHFALSTHSMKPEEKAKAAKIKAIRLFSLAASGYQRVKQDQGRFGDVTRDVHKPPISDGERKKFITSLKNMDPHTRTVAVGELRGEEYRKISSQFLDPKSPDFISPRDPPEEVARKLMAAKEAFRKSETRYPAEARSDDAAVVFRIRLRKSLQATDPERRQPNSERRYRRPKKQIMKEYAKVQKRTRRNTKRSRRFATVSTRSGRRLEWSTKRTRTEALRLTSPSRNCSRTLSLLRRLRG